MKQELGVEKVFTHEGCNYIVEFDCEYDRDEVLLVAVTRVETYEQGVGIDADVFAAALEVAGDSAAEMQSEYVADIEQQIGDYWLP